MVLELVVWDVEPSTQRLYLRMLIEGRHENRLKMLVVGMDHAVFGHGDQSPAERVDTDSVQTMNQPGLDSRRSRSVVTQRRSFESFHSLSVPEIVDRPQAGVVGIHPTGSGIGPLWEREVLDGLDCPVRVENLEVLFRVGQRRCVPCCRGRVPLRR